MTFVSRRFLYRGREKSKKCLKSLFEQISTIFQVRFNDIPIVHHMIKWNYAYRAARKGPWEQMARNRERFRRRINHIASVLNPILTCQHRTRIWHERFVPLWEENRENCERCLNCIIFVINQILMNQHHIHIWQQRFAREP